MFYRRKHRSVKVDQLISYKYLVAAIYAESVAKALAVVEILVLAELAYENCHDSYLTKLPGFIPNGYVYQRAVSVELIMYPLWIPLTHRKYS